MYQHKASYTLVWLISFTLFHISDLNNVPCLKNNMFVACATGKTKTLVNPSTKQRQNPCRTCVPGFEYVP